MHRLVARGALVVHLTFVGFTVVGGFVACLVPWVLGRMAVTRAACPLSRMEDWGREGAGRPSLDERGFIAHYFEGRVYPSRWARGVELAVGSVVIGSWVAFASR